MTNPKGTEGTGGNEGVTRFPGVFLDLYYGTDLIGTGSVGDYRPPPSAYQNRFGNSSTPIASS